MYWKIRLAVKLLAGGSPALKSLLTKMGYFRHGRMDSAQYARGVFARHLACFAPSAPEPAKLSFGRPSATCMEIGPGDALLTALCARAAGFGNIILVDAGRQAKAGMAPYVALSRVLRAEGHDVPEVTVDWSLEDVLQACNAEYRTDGLASLASLETGSVDFSFSHAVLEHLPKNEVAEFLQQLKRVVKPDGISSHVVDLRDHLGGSIRQLELPEQFWESARVRRAGVYTNRLRLSAWLRAFDSAGFAHRVVERQVFPALPVRRERLDAAFRDLGDEDLRTHGFHVVLTGAEAASSDATRRNTTEAGAA